MVLLGRDPEVLGSDLERVFLYKPPELPVFPLHQDISAPSLLSFYLKHGGTAEGWPEGFNGGIAHRLDNRTSGIVVAARSLEKLAALRADFAEHRLRKHYLFAGPVHPDFQGSIVKTPIGHHPTKTDRMVAQKAGIRCRGKWYPTWTLLKERSSGLYEAEIRTGVMHQIRVHAALMGVPLTGDTLYGGALGPFFLCHYRIAGPGWAFQLPDWLQKE
jgi:23S rRNA pseudouridine1911/1915/1917 synthase